MPSRKDTIQEAINLMNAASYPNGNLTSNDAWLGFYQVLLWYVDINHNNYTALPHIIDADKLRPPASYRTQGKKWSSPWQTRAAAIESYLAQHLKCQPLGVRKHLDLLMKSPNFQGLQRQNPLGTAFSGLVRYVLEQFGDSTIDYELEASAPQVYPGIQLPGRSKNPSIDILARRNQIPCTIISIKWGLRHDRVSDITNECPIYKAAASRSRTPLEFYVVTNEFDPARLNKVLSDPCIDGVVHIHKNAVCGVCGLNGRLNNMINLPDFFQHTFNW